MLAGVGGWYCLQAAVEMPYACWAHGALLIFTMALRLLHAGTMQIFTCVPCVSYDLQLYSFPSDASLCIAVHDKVATLLSTTFLLKASDRHLASCDSAHCLHTTLSACIHEEMLHGQYWCHSPIDLYVNSNEFSDCSCRPSSWHCARLACGQIWSSCWAGDHRAG